MPYFIEPVVPPPMTLPNGAPNPQLQQFIAQLTANLNGLEQRNLSLVQVLPAGTGSLLIFK